MKVTLTVELEFGKGYKADFNAWLKLLDIIMEHEVRHLASLRHLSWALATHI